MKKINSFTQQYPLSKTLRFRLIPQGATAQYFQMDKILEADKKRASDYSLVKGLIDRYHKAFIEHALSILQETLSQQYSQASTGPKDFPLLQYAALYATPNKSDAEKKKLSDTADKLRKTISDHFRSMPEFAGLFGKEIIKKYLPNFEKLTDEEKSVVAEFSNFTTYFVGFHENRRNMYTGEGKATEIAFRLIDQNLPKFLDNCRSFASVIDALDSDVIELASSLTQKLFGDDISLAHVFDIAFFVRLLTQGNIDKYNQLIGGYTTESGIKVQGLNEFINLHTQKTGNKLPKFKILYKQILSDRSTISYIPEKFSFDNELLETVKEFYLHTDDNIGLSVKECIEKLMTIFTAIDTYDPAGIFIKSGASLNEISKFVFGSWSIIQDRYYNLYDTSHAKQMKDIEKHEAARKKWFDSFKSHSLWSIYEVCADSIPNAQTLFTSYVSNAYRQLAQAVFERYNAVSELLETPYPADKKLIANDADIALIKGFLDAVKALQWFILNFSGSGKEENKDETFYADFSLCISMLDSITPLYNKVRNYVTQKPFSEEKIKINFDNPQFLGGWVESKITDYSSFLLRDGNFYYLAVINKDYRSEFKQFDAPVDDDDAIEKMFYLQMADPAKDIQNLMVIDGKTERKTKDLDALKAKHLPANINRIRESRSYMTTESSFSKDDLIAFIDYYKERITEYKPEFGFVFKPSSEYSNFKEFTDDINRQAYQVRFTAVSRSKLMEKVSVGHLYLFKLYSKDFSEYSKGKPNLHTLYFRMLFDAANLADPVYKLNGEAEMFCREASIDLSDTVIHPAESPIGNKNPLNPKKQSTFTYDLIKDRRYTQEQYFLHLPITQNFQAIKMPDKAFNHAVRTALRTCDSNYVIGIDRGERNLLYICVIDGNGRIVEQFSMNSIINESNGVKHVTDYRDLLAVREEERAKARQDWTGIENIKNLKEGYISQVVHVICQLVIKYDAIIAMEDLNSGFKNSRFKVERQVYQKFEKMLIDKLNFLAEKDIPVSEPGGLLNAYQLTNRFESFSTMTRQNGFIFYIPAWMTSKIDPTTGFVDLIHPRYESVAQAKELLSHFSRIEFIKEQNLFEFDMDYSDFTRGVTDYRKKWTLVSWGKRVFTFRNPDKNSQWDNIEIDLTEAFKSVFARFDIDIGSGNIRSLILAREDKAFYAELLHDISLMLQMRNSVTGTDIDYLVSPVRNSTGKCYFSDDPDCRQLGLPVDADANGAYHIAKKAQYVIRSIQACTEDSVDNVSLAISNRDWLEYVQSGKSNG